MLCMYVPISLKEIYYEIEDSIFLPVWFLGMNEKNYGVSAEEKAIW